MCAVTQNPKGTQYMNHVGIPSPLQKKEWAGANLKRVNGAKTWETQLNGWLFSGLRVLSYPYLFSVSQSC